MIIAWRCAYSPVAGVSSAAADSGYRTACRAAYQGHPPVLQGHPDRRQRSRRL